MGRGLKIAIGVLLALLVLIVLNAFALNNETEKASLTVDGAELVKTTSGSLQVLDTGPAGDPEALPVVLIHGSGGAINWWQDQIPLLRDQRRVIAMDMLGYGGSEKPGSGYSVESQANLIAQVLAHLDVEQAVVVGHSLGGKVATALAEGSPDLVAGVVVLDMAPDSSYGGLSGTAKAAQVPLLGQAMWRIAPDFMIRRNIEQAFAPGFDVPDEYVEDIRMMTYPAYRDSYKANDRYTDDIPLNERLEATGVPLLVVFGEEDELFPARESISAFAAIPGAETLLIPGVGHSPQVEAPEETARAITAFADRLQPEPEPAPEPAPKQKQRRNQAGGGKSKNSKGKAAAKRQNAKRKPGKSQNRKNAADQNAGSQNAKSKAANRPSSQSKSGKNQNADRESNRQKARQKRRANTGNQQNQNR